MPNQEDIFGLWGGEYSGLQLVFEFKKDSTCILTFRDVSLDSIEEINGVFDLDFSKKPNSLSIRRIRQLSHPLHTIIEFNGSNDIRIAKFASRWRLRQIAFNQNTSIYLQRVQKPSISS